MTPEAIRTLVARDAADPITEREEWKRATRLRLWAAAFARPLAQRPKGDER